eukprot:357704-Chlamydomonas_euryale.AAC.5
MSQGCAHGATLEATSKGHRREGFMLVGQSRMGQSHMGQMLVGQTKQDGVNARGANTHGKKLHEAGADGAPGPPRCRWAHGCAAETEGVAAPALFVV